MIKVIRSPEALEDITSHFLYLAGHNIKAADSLLKSLEDTFNIVSHFPEIAPFFPTSRKELGSVRWMPVKDFGNFLVFYQYQEETAHILRVFHKSQDIAVILETD